MTNSQLNLFGDEKIEQVEKKFTKNVDPFFQDFDDKFFSKDNLSKLEKLEKLKDISFTCQRCILGSTRKNIVFSDGNLDAKIMIIGEGPGENEDETGIPFVGKAGQLLTKIIESVGFVRSEDIYIANIVKCRPPENRAPYENEMKACFGYIKRQIDIIKPSIILLSGATALKGITASTTSITRSRGEWILWNGINVMPIFHPSYLLRNPSKDVGSPKWLMWQDMKKIKEKLKELGN